MRLNSTKIGFQFLAVLFLCSKLVFANDDIKPCQDAFKEKSLQTFKEVPIFRGQKIQIQNVIDEDTQEEVWIGASEATMQSVSSLSAKAKPVLDRLLGLGSSDIEISGGVSGSAARYGIFESANDLDLEAQIVLRAKNGSTDSLFNPKSPLLRRIARYLQEHVEWVLRENPSYRFIELKAGEYLDPDTNTIEGIKWWLDDLRNGFKIIHEAKGDRKITLVQALSEPARIKIDWAVPAVIDPLNEYDYTEASVLYRLGLRVNQNQARLRFSDDITKNEPIPVRITSINLSQKDLLASLELSAGENPTSIESVHQSLIKTIEKYKDEDRLKVIRRVFALLSFWENELEFTLLNPQFKSSESILDQFQAIMLDPKIIASSKIKARAEIRKIAVEHEVILPISDALWLNKINENYHTNLEAIDELIEFESEAIEVRLTELFKKYPVVPYYINYVMKRIPYLIEGEGEFSKKLKLSDHPIFVSLKPNAVFLKKIEKKIKNWKVKYPDLVFIDPKTLHMTINFFGQLTEPAIHQISSDINEQIKSLPEHSLNSLSVNQGGLYIIGKKDQFISLKYSKNEILSELSKKMRSHGIDVGAKPEKTFLELTPHISIVEINDKRNPIVRKQVKAFLTESIGELEKVSFDAVEILSTEKSKENGYVKIK